MPRVTKRHLALTLKVAVAISLTILFLHYASPAQILRALRSANPWLVSTIIPMTLVCMALAASATNPAFNVVALLAVGIAGWLLGDEPPGTAVFYWFQVACVVAIAVFFLAFHGVAPADAFALSLLTFARTLFQAMIGFALEIRTLFRLPARG